MCRGKNKQWLNDDKRGWPQATDINIDQLQDVAKQNARMRSLCMNQRDSPSVH